MSQSEAETQAAEERLETREPAVGAIRSIVVFVDDLEKALAFYVDTLGLEMRREHKPEPGLRTVEIALPDAETSLVLVRPSLEPMGPDEASRAHDRIGEPTGVVFEVARLDNARKELERRGVEFVTVPTWRPLGGRALSIRDPFDNELMLLEPAAP